MGEVVVATCSRVVGSYRVNIAEAMALNLKFVVLSLEERKV